MSRCAGLHSLVFLFAFPRGISTIRGWKPNSVWCCDLHIFFFNFFIFSFPLWVAITSLTEVWCAHMGIITLFGMVCVEQACKYGQERSCCVDLCEQNKFVSWVLLGRYLNWFFTTNSYKQSVLWFKMIKKGNKMKKIVPRNR